MSNQDNNAEKNLINRASLGDKTAVTTLYERHVDQIYRYIAYRVPDSAAEDLTSDVFVKMVEGLPKFTYTGAPFEAWLYRIASARVADFHRKRGRRQHTDMDDRITDERPLPEERMQEKQDHNEVREALQNLSADDQEILILRFVEQKSHQEVAEIVNKTPDAVRVAQHRALKRLGAFLNADGKERHYLRGTADPE